MYDKTVEEFIKILASKEPVPGGGSASALVSALGISLGNMVGGLTLGKEKYKDVEEDILRLNKISEEIRLKLLDLIKKDLQLLH